MTNETYYQTINPLVLRVIKDNTTTRGPSRINTISLLKEIQTNNRSIMKFKGISSSNGYQKIGDRYTIIGIHNLIKLANKDIHHHLTTQKNLEGRVFLTVRIEDGYETHHNKNKINNYKSNTKTTTQDKHRTIHKKEYLELIRG